MEKLEGILKGLAPPSLLGQKTLKEQDQELRSHADSVIKLPDTARSLISTYTQQVLEWLSPAEHTIAYAAVLDIVLESGSSDTTCERGWLQKKVEDFVEGFDAIHIRFHGEALTRILKRISVNGLFTPQKAAEVLAHAILRVDPSGSVFTSTHLVLANLALTVGSADAALRVFEKDITAYPSPTSLRAGRPLSDPSLPPSVYISTFTGLTDAIKAPMILDYGTAVSQIYISLKEWLKARGALETVITHPTKDKGIAKAMSTAYKRWILVSLLGSGKAPTLPSYTPSAAKASYGHQSHVAYNALAAAFDNSDPAQLLTELATHTATFEDDGNMGLVRQVLQAYQKWQVINLELSFSRISTSRIREETFSGETGQRLPSTEAMAALLREMIASGMLKAKFELDEHGNETYVAFKDESATLSEAEFAQEIARRHIVIKDLTAQYKVTNERLSANKEYVRFVYKEQKRQADDGNQNVGFDATMEDEDLMGDVLSTN